MFPASVDLVSATGKGWHRTPSGCCARNTRQTMTENHRHISSMGERLYLKQKSQVQILDMTPAGYPQLP